MRPMHFNKVDTNDCPCKDCKPPKRNGTCHGTCEAYGKWKEEHDAKLAELQYQKDLNGVYYSGAEKRSKVKQLRHKGIRVARNKYDRY